jgi:predicted phosphodiesterase
MNLADRLAAIEGAVENEEVSKAKQAPSGWQAGVTWHGSHGEITTGTLNETPKQWDDILRSRGLDPEVFEVVSDTMKWCSWDGWTKTADGETEPSICYSFKAEIRKRRPAEVADVSLEELYKSVQKIKPKKFKGDGESTFVVALSDWQTGNKDGGGVSKQLEAVASLTESIPQRIADLRKIGHSIGHVVVLGMGDLVEGCSGHYPAQQFRVELDRRDQVKFVRRAIRDILVAVAPTAPQVSVVAIPGNHGENRQNGKSITSVHDNDDVAVFEQVAEILAMNPDAFGHVGFRLSRDEVALGISVSGHILAVTHGHVTKPGSNAAQALWNWWERQSMGRAYPCVADADILISGHYHHLNVKEQENRALFVCPSLTQVGDYFADSYGVRTACGTLSMVVTPDGWGELNLL